MSTGTLPVDTGRSEQLAPATAPQVLLALECDRPLERSTGHWLTGTDEVLFGRGAERQLRLTPESGLQRLTIRSPDARMSTTHARLLQVDGQWMIEDLNSRNGVFVNGEQVSRAELFSGDVIELGHTFFVFTIKAGAGNGGGELKPVVAAPSLITFLPELARSFTAALQVARSRIPVLILGETGTGKEVVAKTIHSLSGRSGAFVGLNCGQLTPSLVESELFGHTKGAFTGAEVAKPGLIRAAHGGTLMLDEIGDLPLPLQATLLRVLQEGEVLPVGATQPVRVDFRVLAATHHNLKQLVSEDRFRSDLLARLNGLSLTLPPLRERREDLGLLIGAVLRSMQAEGVTFTRDAMRALFLYSWPRNIRELEKALELALALRGDAPVDVTHLPEDIRSFHPQASSAEESGEMDALTRRDRLVQLMQEHGGNVSAVAREMGVARMQVQRWLKRFGLEASGFRR